MFAGRDIENRTVPEEYRGRIAIHASKQVDDEALAKYVVLFPELKWRKGVILGTVQLVDTVQEHSSKWGDAWHLWHWVLADPRPFSGPLPVARGGLGLWTWYPPRILGSPWSELASYDSVGVTGWSTKQGVWRQMGLTCLQVADGDF